MGRILRSSSHTLAAMLLRIIGVVLSLIVIELANVVLMEVDNLSAICHQFYTGPYASCGYCNQSPSDHHGDRCLEKFAFLCRRTLQATASKGTLRFAAGTSTCEITRSCFLYRQ